MTSTDLYKKYRPKSLDDIVGQDDVVKTVRGFLKSKTVPHCLLLSGPSGVGKTTLARIIAKEVGCKPANFIEVACPLVDAMEQVREIAKKQPYRAMGGGPRVWYLDEIQALSKAPFAQQGLLLPMEEERDYVYFILSTTDPSKINAAVKGRCTTLSLGPIGRNHLSIVLTNIAKKEGVKPPSNKVVDRCTELANGSAREAINLLQKVLAHDKEADQLNTLQSEQVRLESVELARVLINPKSRWPDVVVVLKELDEKDAEGIRRLVLAYCRPIILSGGQLAQAAYKINQSFRDNVLDSGFDGIIANCWEIKGK